MESLKPLKIIGALALLCLATYQAIPDGRLNTQQWLYSLQQPNFNGLADPNLYAPKHQPQILEDREFMLAWQKRQWTGINASDGQGFDVIEELADQAIKSESATKLAIAAIDISGGVSSIPHQKFEPSVKLTQNNNKLANLLISVCQAGKRAEPHNALWPLFIASSERVLKNPIGVKKALVEAASCSNYNEHYKDQVKLRSNNSPAPQSAFNVVAIQSAVSLPHLSNHKSTIAHFIGSTDPKDNIRDRITAIKIGKLISEQGETYITQLVGRSILRVAAGINENNKFGPTKTFSYFELEQIAQSHGIKTNGLLEGATAVYSGGQPFENQELLTKIFNQAPLVTQLPFTTAILFIVGIAVLLYSNNLANKSKIRPIRYLFVLPCALFFAFDPTIDASFHSQLMLHVALFSLPVAYFTFTEKFVPVIHLGVTASAFLVLLPSSSIPRLAFELAFISAVALLAWWQNRKPEHWLSKYTAVGFPILAALIFAQWIFRSYAAEKTFNLDLTMVLCFASILFGIAHPDKMKSWLQTNILSIFGFVYFLFSCITSVAASGYMWTQSSYELQRAYDLRANAQRAFDTAAERANKSPLPNVKLKDK